MSFNIALSGINAAQKDIDVTANNISNVNTFGFKESRAEFADVYSSSVFSNSKTTVGQGVTTADVAQQFSQGSFLFSNNSLDLAIDGSGFFATSANAEDLDVNLTRAGAFKLDENSFMVNSAGQFLRVFPVNPDGTVSSVALASTIPLQIPSSAGQPQPTANVDIGLNLPAGETALDPANFDPTDNTTYNAATSLTIYDSLGQSYVATTYYVKDTNVANQWAMFTTMTDPNGSQPVDIVAPPPPQTQPTGANGQTGMYMNFNADGTVASVNGGNPVVTEPLGVAPPGGAGLDMGGADVNQTVTFNFNNPTQFASAFEVQQLAQDGVTVGRLTSVDIGSSGLVNATYSNGTTQPLGKVALVKVANEQGLAPVGNTAWTANQSSGDPIAGEADQGSYGRILSGTLEQSNVNLTTELVDLITGQRNFQANSRSLEVNNTITQTILQIR
ncbi:MULTISPECIES: flagellar hook protein FlgE [Corallincola]|uniref:Flagellar hook protein FlgE n=3 Tax=Corallincola TaxID=1775176 RepID=A0A368N4T6_9GAMM|nr:MULTISPECIES: flagellar hook protein FlgE [Corallincola]RCU44594.1 flagellar hook protein FlgE [Corallincola holothuriorum]TAA40339.1 flagellar hook protein FlgE [Corallincola spongiicola]TCI05354.1 flagellar hook protein FlgE [Corallincola luteus]